MTAAVAANRFKTYATFVKLEHTIFSLPLIFSGLLLATRGWPSLRLAWWVLLASVGARAVAMGLNRIIDAEIDARNPRTSRRELPRGAMQRREAWAVVTLAGLLYAVSAAAIAPICLQLAPIPVALFALYPYLKRFTALSHVGLGLAWSLAPVAGWIAAAGTLSGIDETGWLWLFSLLWVTGFDIVYATMDEEFDRSATLYSLPARVGRDRALRMAAVLHAAAFAALYGLWRQELYSPIAFRWLLGVGALLIAQHAVAPRKPEFAFFQLNGAVGFMVLALVLAGMR